MRIAKTVLVVVIGAGVVTSTLTLASNVRGGRTRTQLVCGSARWNVKTLADPDASKVSLRAIKAGVADLTRLPAPLHVPDTLPRQSGFGRVEFHTFRVEADLYGWKRSADDNDVHLVIQGSRATKTMIVELPSTDCIPSSAPARLRARMIKARRALMKACASASFTTTFKRLSGTVTIVGVGFFDRQHNQTGVADHAIELHPVLNFTSTDCAPL
jgi:hypothetical protein